MRAWLCAAEGEALATLGERDGALRALDNAPAALPDETAPDVAVTPERLGGWGHGDSASVEGPLKGRINIRYVRVQSHGAAAPARRRAEGVLIGVVDDVHSAAEDRQLTAHHAPV